MSNSPCILKDTSAGFQRVPIRDELFKHREIECVGEIDAESVSSMILQLRYLQREAPEEEITLYINSPGGEVSSGLALYDVMQAVSCPIRTVCVGMAASMGAILFLAGDRRDILPHARLMLHDPLLPGGGGGSALHINSLARDMMKVRQIIASIIAAHSGKSLDEVFAVTAADTFFDAEEAVAFGLADNIIHRL